MVLHTKKCGKKIIDHEEWLPFPFQNKCVSKNVQRQNEEILPPTDWTSLSCAKYNLCCVIFTSTFHTKAFRVSNTIVLRSGFQQFISKSKRCKNCECCPGSPYYSQITTNNIMIWGAHCSKDSLITNICLLL